MGKYNDALNRVMPGRNKSGWGESPRRGYGAAWGRTKEEIAARHAANNPSSKPSRPDYSEAWDRQKDKMKGKGASNVTITTTSTVRPPKNKQAIQAAAAKRQEAQESGSKPRSYSKSNIEAAKKRGFSKYEVRLAKERGFSKADVDKAKARKAQSMKTNGKVK